MEAGTFTQMNVRIGAHLKHNGDEALSSIGFTPTQAVRVLWQYAAQRGESLEEVKRFLMKAENNTVKTASSDVLQAGWQIIPNGLSSLGISEEAMVQAIKDDSGIIEDARLEQAKQKGWL